MILSIKEEVRTILDCILNYVLVEIKEDNKQYSIEICEVMRMLSRTYTVNSSA